MALADELVKVRRVADRELRTFSGVCSFVDADDVAQEVAIAVVSRGYRAAVCKGVWVARNMRSSEKQAKLREQRVANGRAEAVEASPLEALVAGETASRIWEAVDRLPKVERAIILARYRDGASLKQCVEMSGWSRGTVTRALRSGLETLRLSLAGLASE